MKNKISKTTKTFSKIFQTREEFFQKMVQLFFKKNKNIDQNFKEQEKIFQRKNSESEK